MKYQYDLIVIGGGSAGLSVASISARLGVKVALIDAGPLGGDCLHYGCVPSKTLIHSAHIAHYAKTSQLYGVQTGDVTTDFPAVMRRVQAVIASIHGHADSPDRYRALGCDVWTHTKAQFVDDHTVDVGEGKIDSKIIAICAGSRPSVPDIPGLKAAGFQTNESIFSLTEQPKHLIVIGSGPIGYELSQAFQRLGTQVTLMNRSDRLLAKEDSDVQSVIRTVFTREGIDLKLGVEMRLVSSNEKDKTVLITGKEGEEHVTGDEILVAAGRQSNADTLQLENAGVAVDERGYVKTDSHLRTSRKHIYAAGDITGHLQFTHSAGYEAGVIVSNGIMKIPKKIDLSSIPWTTFTDPEVASTGINETEAKRRNIPHTVATFPLEHQDRALAESPLTDDQVSPEGFIKLILGKKDHILGCQIVAPHAGELIHEWIVARAAKVPISKISKLTHVYPTLAGGNQQIAGAYLGEKFFTPKVRKWIRFLYRYRNQRIDE